jgi:hypothetical protein
MMPPIVRAWGHFHSARHILKEHAMWINASNARLGLAARRGLRLKDARGADLRDIVLDPGETFVVDSNSPLIVMPLGECATVDVKSAAPLDGPRADSWLRALWPQRPSGAVARALPISA